MYIQPRATSRFCIGCENSFMKYVDYHHQHLHYQCVYMCKWAVSYVDGSAKKCKDINTMGICVGFKDKDGK